MTTINGNVPRTPASTGSSDVDALTGTVPAAQQPPTIEIKDDVPPATVPGAPQKLDIPAPDDNAYSTSAVQKARQQFTADVPVSMLEVLRVVQQTMQENRKANLDQRLADLSAQVSALKNGADLSRKAAKEEFNAALTQAIFTGISGAISVTGGAAGLKTMAGAKASNPAGETPAPGASATTAKTTTQPATGQAKAGAADVDAVEGFQMQGPRERSNAVVQPKPASKAEAASDLGTLDPAINSASAKAQAYSTIAGGFSSAAQGLGTGIAAGFTATQRGYEADAKDADAQATEAQARYSSSQDFAQNYQQLRKSIEDLMSTIISSGSDTANKISRDLV